jgi:hypothetical protein
MKLSVDEGFILSVFSGGTPANLTCTPTFRRVRLSDETN